MNKKNDELTHSGLADIAVNLAYIYPEDQFLYMYRLVCVHCGEEYAPDEIIYNCRRCGHLLAVQYDLDNISVSRSEWDKRPLSVWRYREILPVTIDPVTLNEGGTPLYHLKKIGEELGLSQLYAKHEGMNPSGSFKDRGMTVGVSMALQLKKTHVACASTGKYVGKSRRIRCKSRYTGSRTPAGRKSSPR